MSSRSILSLDLRHHRVGSHWRRLTVRMLDCEDALNHSSDPLSAARGLLGGLAISAVLLTLCLAAL